MSEKLIRLSNLSMTFEDGVTVLDGINLYLEILVPAVAEPLTYEGEYWLYSEGHNTRSTRETVWASLNGTASQQDTEAGDTLSWEMRPQPYVEQGQLNARQFLALGLLKIDAPDPPTSSVATAILRRIDYLNLRDARGEGITNAAIVLLHNHPETIIPGATVQLELVAQDNHALLRNEVGGGISCQVEESLRLLFEQYLPMAVATSTTTENPVIALNFPPQEAVHDVLLDAIVGKNYETGQPVRVSVHPDKLIISMPCGGIETPGGANPVLARALHLMGYLDSQNANFERAVLRCGDMGAPLPVIEHGSRETTVTFSLDSQKTWQMSTPLRKIWPASRYRATSRRRRKAESSDLARRRPRTHPSRHDPSPRQTTWISRRPTSTCCACCTPTAERRRCALPACSA